MIDWATTSSIDASRDDSRPAAAPVFGIYDPHSRFERDRALAIEHVFVYWQALDKSMLARKMKAAAAANRTFMITVEPYTKAANWRDGGERLFTDIAKGRFDRQIDGICSAMKTYPAPVLIRWGHEMEDPTGRYPWARKDPEGYKSAYRYFVSRCRNHLPQALFLWSPKGEKNLADFYPGDAYVDYIGLAVWGLQAMDRDFWGHDRSFAETLGEKYRRVAYFKKPVIVAELGFSGDAGYRSKWIEELFSRDYRALGFDLLRAVIFFNDKEPSAWPMGYGSPDWQLAHDMFRDRDLSQRSASAF